MALIHCPECGRMVSPNAEECPGCGAPIKMTTIQTPIKVVDSEKEANENESFPWVLPVLFAATLIGVIIMIIVLKNK